MLSAAELASMRETTFSNLPDSCRIVSPVETRTAGGGVTQTPSVGPILACRVTPSGLTATEGELVERVGSLATWNIALPANTPIMEAEQIDATVNGITRRLEVASVLGPRSYELERRIVCVEAA